MKNDTAVQKVASRAIECLRVGRPFSAIRLGDGEGRVLLWPTGIEREDLDKHLRFWFGRDDIDDRQLHVWKSRLTCAIWNADAVGYYHGDGRNRYWRAARTYAQLKPGIIVGENSLHRELWDSRLLHKIVAAAEDVVVVTCREAAFLGDVVTISVPEEAHTSGTFNDHPEKFSSIRGLVRREAGPGALVLVGAGLFGKIYCDDAKQGGAVAIDVGSLFDMWAGVQSRSYLTNRPQRGTIGAANESADPHLG